MANLKKKKYLIKNIFELEELAKELTYFLKPGVFLLMQGDLGVGKTTLSQIIARQLGIKQPVNSPTFTLCQQYEIPNKDKNICYLNHFDFFRLNQQDKLNPLEELTVGNLNIIEWPEKNIQFWQNKDFVYLNFKWSQKYKEARIIEVSYS